MIVVVCALALALFLVRPRVGRLRGRVAHAIAQAVGRNVEISSIHLRLVPRPGFELDNLVIHDDATFGAEPLVRAPEVTAWLRVGALLRGHIEIASLSLNETSLNLARNAAGKWNVEDLVERTSHTALAPTGAPIRQAASFPYIEATHARINFKVGNEKTHFAFTNAAFALWQESQDTWSVRLRAAPIRTDSNLTDTGLIEVNGSWNRSSEARQTPFHFSFQWKQAQIGQLSRLFYGTDKNWRGGVLISGTAAGTPEQLQLNVDGSVDDFRHRDVMGGGNLHLAAHCGGDLNLPARVISNVDCVSPTGVGFLELKGSASGPRSDYAPFSTYDFWLVGSKVPANGLFRMAQHANDRFGNDITALGELDGSIEINRQGPTQPVRLQGGGAAHGLQLETDGNSSAIRIGTLPFTFVLATSKSVGIGRKRTDNSTGWIPASQAQLQFGPVNLAMGRPTPLQTSATVSRDGYTVSIKGDGAIERLLQAAYALRVPAPAVSASGNANVDLTITSGWVGLKPTVIGTSQLRSVNAQIRGLNAPIEIASAHLTITEDAIRVQNLTAISAGTTWRGSFLVPRPCASAIDCAFGFNLHTPAASVAALNTLLNPALANRPWYRILPFDSQPSYLLRAKASGKLAIDEFTLGKAICSGFSTDVKLNSGSLTLSNMTGNVLGGHATGDWKAVFTRNSPTISGSGTLEKVALAEIAQLMHDGWVSGTGTAKYTFSTSGRSWQELLASADASAEFDVKDGTFPHLVLVGNSGPLRTNEFAGSLNLKNGKFSFDDTKLKAGDEVYTVSGTAALSGVLAIRIANENNGGFNVTGTLFKTRVSFIPTAQAALKP